MSAASHRDQPSPDDSSLEQVEAMRTMFGRPRLALEPVFQGTAADEVISNPRIAIVDDEPINIRVVRKHLELAGYQRFLTTSDSRGAMHLIRTELPDVVLLDIMMPHVSGLEILDQIRRSDSFADLPVIILTAASERETKLEALRLGATEFLTKPVDPVELQSRLRNVLTIKAHQDRLKNYAWELELEVAVRTAELADAHRQVVECLARVGEYRDNETSNHVVRVGYYAEILARQMGMPGELCGRIRQAAALHDIGKVGIPDAVLLKPGRLTDEEMDHMRQHCRFGCEICAPAAGLDKPAPQPTAEQRNRPAAAQGRSPIMAMASSIALYHHERWDGTGYPCGLAGNEIPIEARIAAVADVFDALTSKRPYKEPVSLDESLDTIRRMRGTHFDPAVVDAFEAAHDEIVAVYRQYADAASAAGATQCG